MFGLTFSCVCVVTSVWGEGVGVSCCVVVLLFYCAVLYLCVTTVAHCVACVNWVRCVTVFWFGLQ